ncbi:FAD-dependent hydroxylase [Lyngbya confervoides]|uniref:FAD-dependent hydroxylase n=1 Tax=Lyngbya confervoides BDU141951 TaxID=1574623 RepID=A0ABD4T7D3_9CYAN|nr:FAD-dependent hydroxylase [Lyngbya confervoides]MCM1984662.1 FAD-dependent hydroxylase [Lyngbya confervoides BDU141951]
MSLLSASASESWLTTKSGAGSDHNQLDSNSYDYDVAIVGGGIVGTTLAAALGGSALRVALIEAQPTATAIAKGQAYAIHLSSKRIWQAIGVWDQIEPKLEPFRQVRLSDACYPHVVEFASQDLNAPALGYVAEHRHLLPELLAFVQNCPNVDYLCPVQVGEILYGSQSALVPLYPGNVGKDDLPVEPRQLQVQLVVAADGSRSRVRESAGIPVRGRQYGQSCLVATIAPDRHHQNIAYERFWPSGPFAILPANDRECRIVWTAPHREAQALLNLDDAEFEQRLIHRYGSQMGPLKVVSPRYIFPARIQHATRYVQTRLALVGDAAHTCHPVGGQGLNLGIRDAAALAQILKNAGPQQDLGDLRVLRRYQGWRRRQNVASLQFTHLLNLTFSNEYRPVQIIRRFGLRLMRWVPPVRITALKFMAGLLSF